MIDLHLHSTYSDGTLTPTELVGLAVKGGLEMISVTDHDTIEGTEETFSAARGRGLRVVSGLEISVYHDEYNFHLLGYNYDRHCVSLIEGLQKLQQSRNRRNSSILAKLQKIGIEISPAELQKISQGGQTGRPHIARLLVEKGMVKNIDQAFAHYLKKGACAYVSRYILSVDEAIKLIHGAGGITVLAHPAQISYSIEMLERLLKVLVGKGLDGVEVHYPSQKGKFLKKLRVIAARNNLIETGGSDYHGDIRPGTAIAGGRNLKVPDSVLVEFLKRVEHIKET